MTNVAKNQLYYGDNLEVLRRYIPDSSVDLVYLDPPFNSDQDFNVLFAEHDGAKAAAQIKAFEDTWGWDEAAERAFLEVVEAGGQLSVAMQALRAFLGASDMMAYLSMMAPRLQELRRVLAPTGSLYLHCDTTAAHYLKILLDAIFDPRNFRADICWKRTSAHGNVISNYALVSDQILFYTRGKSWTWNQIYQPYDPAYVESHYGQVDKDGRRFTTRDLTAPMLRASSGQLYAWKGVRPISSRCWSFTIDRMREFEKRELLVYGRSGVPRMKLFLDEQSGVPVSDIWTDIPPINSQAQERLGYPTQKPQALLERIINASTNLGDTVLDVFCGCGTTIGAAQRLGRRWIGIDITHLAINLIRHRLVSAHGAQIAHTFTVTGEPVSSPDAEDLARQDRFQFQCWALGLIGARPTEPKKGADGGIDGRLFFHDEPQGGPTRVALFSVKSGKLKATDVRDLRAVIEREKAALGALICLDEPTKPMRTEAATAGFYTSMYDQQQYPKLQLLTVNDLLEGRSSFRYPSSRQINVTFKKAPKASAPQPDQGALFEGVKTKMARAKLPSKTSRRRA